jgi:hypothetical protein
MIKIIFNQIDEIIIIFFFKNRNIYFILILKNFINIKNSFYFFNINKYFKKFI